MTAPSSMSQSFASIWLCWYTSGLPTELREDRRAEIRSDLAEHEDYRSGDGWGARRIERERLLRTILGVPADLRWRRETLVSPRLVDPSGPLSAAWTWTRWEWPTLAGLALGSFYLLFALYVAGIGVLEGTPILSLFSLDDLSGRPIGAGIVAALGIAVIAASVARLLLSQTAALVLGCAAVPAFPFFWMVLPTVLAIVVILGASLDLGRQHGGPQGRQKHDAPR